MATVYRLKGIGTEAKQISPERRRLYYEFPAIFVRSSNRK